VLLAVIGPQWTTCERDGRRRLDFDDDWVRDEVRSALARGILVVPVLFGRDALPPAAELPADLHPLLGRQHRVIGEQWDDDFEQLVKDIARVVPPDDVASASAGLAGLRRLMAEQAAVAQAVGRSSEGIDTTYRQLARLESHKAVHDALHTIELECLWPLQQGGGATRLRPFKVKLAGAAQRIRERLSGGELAPALAQDLADQLDSAETALQAAVDAPSPQALELAVAELQLMLSGLPAQLDAGITAAAAELRLDRLLELMAAVRDGVGARAEDPELGPFVAGIDALSRLRDELERRVAEHAKLQRLDAKLRAVCGGATAPAMLPAETRRVAALYTQFDTPVAAPLAEAKPDLDALLHELQDVPAPDQAAALGDFFRAVASVFRDVDAELKDFCLRLAEVGRPLRTVLQMVGGG
jgi:hypothetical protein